MSGCHDVNREQNKSNVVLTAEIVNSFLSTNHVGISDIEYLIKATYGAISDISSNEYERSNVLQPAVPIEESVTDDYITCLEDGKKLTLLKRHLRDKYGMTPNEYRVKWGLPLDYPMIAPRYSRKRSDLARRIGLGRKPREATEAHVSAVVGNQ